MEITGNYTFSANQEAVWKLLMDPDAIAAALPGVDEMLPVENEANAWQAIVKVSIGTVSGQYSGYVRMADIEAPNQYRLNVDGEGQNSIISGSALISLVPEGSDKTVVSWTATANISGKIASIGQRLIKATANMMSKRFFNGLAKQIPEREK